MAEGRTAFPVDPDGWYVEPCSVTDFLLAREEFPKHIWDPACGQGNITEVCRRWGHHDHGSDIRLRVPLTCSSWLKLDFLKDEPIDFHGEPWALVSNPPYGRALLAEAFIRRAWALPGIEKLAVFVNSKFLFSQRRAAGLFIDIPPTRIWPVLPRPSCPPGEWLRNGGTASGGVENFVWIVIERGAEPGTQLLWRKAVEADLSATPGPASTEE